jgi:hypothetical protein
MVLGEHRPLTFHGKGVHPVVIHKPVIGRVGEPRTLTRRHGGRTPVVDVMRALRHPGDEQIDSTADAGDPPTTPSCPIDATAAATPNFLRLLIFSGASGSRALDSMNPFPCFTLELERDRFPAEGSANPERFATTTDSRIPATSRTASINQPGVCPAEFPNNTLA